MKLQVVLSEVSFNSPAHYFIKLSLNHDPYSEEFKCFQRTSVSPTCSRTPQLAQTTFYFDIPSSHPLVDSISPTIKKSVLNLTACLINQDNTPPSITVIGNVSLVVFPHASLQRNILDMQIVYFHDENDVEIGKCIVTLSKSRDGLSQKARLDPIESFLQLSTKPPLIKTKASEKLLSPNTSFIDKSLVKTKTSDTIMSPHKVIKNSFKSEESVDDSVRDSNPDFMQAIADSYELPSQNHISKDDEKIEKEIMYNAHDLDQRQRLIDKLLEELDHRTNAVRKVGQDLYRLREKNAEQEETIVKLSKKLEDTEKMNSKILNTIDLDMLSIDELRNRYAILAARLQANLAKNEELSEMLEGAQEKRNEIEKRMLEIQQAHTSQQIYVQRLQDKLSNISRYRSTIKIQEQIIRKFESLMNESTTEPEIQKEISQIQERSTIPLEKVVNQDALVASLERENKMLLAKIHDLESCLDKVQNVPVPHIKVQDDTIEMFKLELEAERNNLLQLDLMDYKKKDSDECSDFALLLRAEKAEARVVALEQELEESAIEFTQKVADLEAELREFQRP